MNYPSSELVIDPLLIRKYDVGGPGYISYPAPDRFVEAFGESTLRYWLSTKNIGGITRPLALHLPGPAVIDAPAYPAAAKKRPQRNAASSVRFVESVGREITLTAGLLVERHVSEIHWAGCTPAFIERGGLQAMCKLLATEFVIDADCEISIDIDAGSARAGVVAQLCELGFNRISLCLKDPDCAMSSRAQPMAHRILEEVKAGGFRTINFNIAYGLPGQTLERFSGILERLLDFDPDRITLHSPAQRLAVESTMPSTETTLQILTLAIGRLLRAGFLYIGMNQFAKSGDDLAVAQRQGRLQHNCHGYSSRPDCDLLGFGPRAISRVGPAYSHNMRGFGDYSAALDAEKLPVQTGVVLNRDDLVRRAVIQALLCQFRVSIDSIEASYLLNFRRYFERELADLAALEDDGLVENQPDWLVVTPKGRLLVQTVCKVFDRYLRDGLCWAGTSGAL